MPFHVLIVVWGVIEISAEKRACLIIPVFGLAPELLSDVILHLPNVVNAAGNLRGPLGSGGRESLA
jgi:hypothetical protein